MKTPTYDRLAAFLGCHLPAHAHLKCENAVGGGHATASRYDAHGMVSADRANGNRVSRRNGQVRNHVARLRRWNAIAERTGNRGADRSGAGYDHAVAG